MDEVYNDEVRIAEGLVEDYIRSFFEGCWKDTTQKDVPKYRILIWGSTIQPKDARDLDLIFEYVSDQINDEKEQSIEGQIENRFRYIDYFTSLDPLVAHYTVVQDIVPQSRVDKVYSIDEEGWLRYG